MEPHPKNMRTMLGNEKLILPETPSPTHNQTIQFAEPNQQIDSYKNINHSDWSLVSWICTSKTSMGEIIKINPKSPPYQSK
jgi:hypothetical protein